MGTAIPSRRISSVFVWGYTYTTYLNQRKASVDYKGNPFSSFVFFYILIV